MGSAWNLATEFPILTLEDRQHGCWDLWGSHEVDGVGCSILIALNLIAQAVDATEGTPRDFSVDISPVEVTHEIGPGAPRLLSEAMSRITSLSMQNLTGVKDPKFAWAVHEMAQREQARAVHAFMYWSGAALERIATTHAAEEAYRRIEAARTRLTAP